MVRSTRQTKALATPAARVSRDSAAQLAASAPWLWPEARGRRMGPRTPREAARPGKVRRIRHRNIWENIWTSPCKSRFLPGKIIYRWHSSKFHVGKEQLLSLNLVSSMSKTHSGKKGQNVSALYLETITVHDLDPERFELTKNGDL